MYKYILAASALIFSHLAVSDEETALNHYQEGLKLYEAGSSTLARGYFEKALKERQDDGTISLEIGGSEEWVETVRGMKKIVVNGEEKFFDYYPNKYIAKIDGEMAERIRLQAKSDAPPECVIMVEYNDKDQNKLFSQNDDAWLDVTIENVGGTMAEDTVFSIESNSEHLTMSQKLKLGNIEPNQKITRKIPLSAENILEGGKIKFNYNLKEKDGYDSQTQIMAINSGVVHYPKLMLAKANVKVINENKIRVSYSLNNKGKGTAKGVKARIVAPSQKGLYLLSKNYKFVTIPPHEAKRVSFDFKVTGNAKKGKDLNFKLLVDDSVADKTLSKAVAFNTIHMYKEEPVDLNIPRGQADNDYSIALIIGNKNYSTMSNVDYAHNDIKAVEKYLVNLAGFKKENIITIKDMSSKEFGRWFGKSSTDFRSSKLQQYVKLAKKKDPNAGLFVYYSGHGAPSLDANDLSSYLVPVDTSQDYIGLEAYPVDEFYESIAKIDAGHTTVVLDTCFSGSTERGLIFKGVSPGLLKSRPVKAPITLKSASIFTSTSQDQVSYWHDESQHSLFSYYFLKGMKGGADFNKDGQLTTGELHDYVEYEVGKYILTNGKPSSQTPQLEGQKGRVMFEYLDQKKS